jgi:hypothetical protein
VADCCECGDEPSGSCATELVIIVAYHITMIGENVRRITVVGILAWYLGGHQFKFQPGDRLN